MGSGKKPHALKKIDQLKNNLPKAIGAITGVMKHHERLLPTAAIKFAFIADLPVNRKVRWVAPKEAICQVYKN